MIKHGVVQKIGYPMASNVISIILEWPILDFQPFSGPSQDPAIPIASAAAGDETER